MTPQPKSVTVEIEKLIYGGDGLARVDGQVVLVPFVLPGERVEVATRRIKNGVLRAQGPSLLEQAAAARTIPRCDYFAKCGGCHYQHSEYAFQLEQKRVILRETLQRLGGLNYDQEIPLVSGEPWNYRNRIQVHFDKQRVGFRKAESHELCPIDHCEISSPLLNEVLHKLPDAVKRREWPEFVQSLEFFTNEQELQINVAETLQPVASRFFTWCQTFLPALAPGAIEYTAANYDFRISRGSFFQVNRFLIDALAREVTSGFTGKYAVDLYAGVGLFSLPLSRSFERVDSVERGGHTFRDLEFNAGRSAVNVRPVKSPSEEFLVDMDETPDLIVADPPRAGLGKEAVDELLRVQAPNLTIVSCDPATLARDLKVLLPKYRIERMVLIDLFPQTFHFETVVHLRGLN